MRGLKQSKSDPRWSKSCPVWSKRGSRRTSYVHDGPKEAHHSLIVVQDALRGSKRSPARSKKGPAQSKSGPRLAKRGHRLSKRGPARSNYAHDGLKEVHDSLNVVQHGRREVLDGLKKGPARSQRSPRWSKSV